MAVTQFYKWPTAKLAEAQPYKAKADEWHNANYPGGGLFSAPWYPRQSTDLKWVVPALREPYLVEGEPALVAGLHDNAELVDGPIAWLPDEE